MPKVWDTFEWDDENKKNGNVQHLREHALSLTRPKNVSSTAILFLRTSGLQTSTFWTAVRTAADT